MNKKTIIRHLGALAASGAVLAMPSLYGQEQDEPITGIDATAGEQNARSAQSTLRDSVERGQIQLGEGQFYLQDLFGAPVRDASGDRVGEIDDIIVSAQDHQPRFAVVSVDNASASESALVPIGELSLSDAQPRLDLDSTSQAVAFELDLERGELGQLTRVNFDREDLSGSVRRASQSLERVFGQSQDLQRGAQDEYLLASELSGAVASHRFDDDATEAQRAATSRDVPSSSFDYESSDARDPSPAPVLSSQSGLSSSQEPSDRSMQASQQQELGRDERENPISGRSETSSSNTLAASSARAGSPDDLDRTPQASQQHNVGHDKRQEGQSTSAAISSATAERLEGDPDQSLQASEMHDVDRQQPVHRDDANRRSGELATRGDTALDEEPVTVTTRDTSLEAEDDDWEMSARQSWDEPMGLRSFSDPQSLIGLEVRDQAGDSIGEIRDILVHQDSREPAFLVVETDDWFDSSAGLIPVSAASASPASADASTTAQNAPVVAGEQQRPEAITLSISEEQFEALASYREGDDVQRYLQRNQAKMSSAFGANSQSMAGDAVVVSISDSAVSEERD